MAIDYNIIGIPLQAIFTIMILSLAYKDNPFARFAISVVLGFSVNYLLTLSTRTIETSLMSIAKGEYILIIYVVFGLLLFTTYYKKISWLSLWSTALLIGVGLGISIPPRVEGQIISQIRASIQIPFGGNPFDIFSSAVVWISLVLTLAYFLFTIDVKGRLELPTKMGRSLLMMTFGAVYAMQVMGYFSLLIARLRFIIVEWLGFAG